MFELESAVAAWAQAANADQCHGAASVAELSDHLYCEIDIARSRGLSDQEAFAAAVTKLGPHTSLASEHAKNRSVLSSVCAFAARIERLDGDASRRRLLIAHALLWAALMVSSSLLMPRGATRGESGWFLIVILLPLFLASEQILRRAMRRVPRERR